MYTMRRNLLNRCNLVSISIWGGKNLLTFSKLWLYFSNSKNSKLEFSEYYILNTSRSNVFGNFFLIVLITLHLAKTNYFFLGGLLQAWSFIWIKLYTTYNENPLILVVTLASTSRNVWYPRAYHNWNKTRKQRALVCRLSLRIPIGTFFTVTTLGVSYSKKIEPNAIVASTRVSSILRLCQVSQVQYCWSKLSYVR